jgi:predicted phosphoribosyltransferase
VLVVDDGLATGYTMIAALQSARRRGAQELVCAVPVSPRDSLERVGPWAQRVVCLVVSDSYSFAVASFYRDFPDMSDEEVKRLLAGNQGARGARSHPGGRAEEEANGRVA